MSGDRSQARRRWLWKNGKRKCVYCGVRLTRRKGPYRLTADHVIPVSKGGTHKRKNLVAACGDCNQAKSDRLPEVWERQRLAVPERFLER